MSEYSFSRKIPLEEGYDVVIAGGGPDRRYGSEPCFPSYNPIFSQLKKTFDMTIVKTENQIFS